MTEPWLVYFAAFAAVFLLVQFGFSSFGRDFDTRRRVNRRLSEIESGAYNPYQVSARRDRIMETALPGPLAPLGTLFEQAGGRQAATIAMVAGALVGAVVLASHVLAQSFALALVTTPLAACVAFLGALAILRTRRIRRFGEQFPEMLDIIVRSLRAGHPFTAALGLVAKEMADPIGSEIGLVSDEIAYGRDIPSALENLYRPVGFEDLRFFNMSVTIQTQTGGNLGEILSRLSALLRERARMGRKVRALSAEGRMSALVLSIFPFLLFGVVNLISPKYYGEMWSNEVFQACLYLSALLMTVGNVIMYRLVNFKI